jgi:hypothetical protein
MTGTRTAIAKHIEAVNARDPAADPWMSDAEMVARGDAVTSRGHGLGSLADFDEAFPVGRLTIKDVLGTARSAGNREWAD